MTASSRSWDETLLSKGYYYTTQELLLNCGETESWNWRLETMERSI